MRVSPLLSIVFVALIAVDATAVFARPSAPATRPRHRADAGVQPPVPMCHARLVVRQTRGATGCFIDERVTGAPGDLRYPCAGGPATATFRNGVYAGTVDADGAVSLSLRTRFHFDDGCDWSSSQSIRGSLEHGLNFEYSESPVAGQRGCAPPCHATGTVEVQRASQ